MILFPHKGWPKEENCMVLLCNVKAEVTTVSRNICCMVHSWTKLNKTTENQWVDDCIFSNLITSHKSLLQGEYSNFKLDLVYCHKSILMNIILAVWKTQNTLNNRNGGMLLSCYIIKDRLYYVAQEVWKWLTLTL